MCCIGVKIDADLNMKEATKHATFNFLASNSSALISSSRFTAMNVRTRHSTAPTPAISITPSARAYEPTDAEGEAA